MKIDLVAFDSYGVKSSCLKIKTEDVIIIVDPGIASEASSFPLPREERRRLRRHYVAEIRRACLEADVVVLTHYHYDHHIPDQELYQGKRLLVKDPFRNINRSQRWRAGHLLEGLEANVEVADGECFIFGSTEIAFSEPLWHGVEETRLGHIIMAKISDGDETLLYTSDVDGPILRETTETIIETHPDILILDGPPTYLLGYIFAYHNLARAVINICHIIEELRAGLIVLDHHTTRDYRYRDFLCEVYKKAREVDGRVLTAAELRGWRPMVLRGYEKHGPTRWKAWKPFDREKLLDSLERAVEGGLLGDEWLEEARAL